MSVFGLGNLCSHSRFLRKKKEGEGEEEEKDRKKEMYLAKYDMSLTYASRELGKL